MGRYELLLVAALLFYGVVFGDLLWSLTFGILVYVVGIISVYPIALWIRTPSLAEARKITVDDIGITVVANSFTRNEEWIAFSGSKERDAYFVLRRKKGRSMILLKRFFIGPNDVDQLRALLTEKAKLSNS